MAKSVRTLLNNAIYKSIADRRFDPIEPDGDEINVAANYLVDILDTYRAEIPFGVSTEITGIENLSNLNASDVTSVQYLLGTVTYPLAQKSREEFERLSAIKTISTIPGIYFFDQGSHQINVYPEPTVSQGQTFFLTYVALYDASLLNFDSAIDATIVPAFMQIFLEYEVAFNLCNDYGVPWLPQRESARQLYYQKLVDNNEYIPPAPVVDSWDNRRLPAPILTYLTEGGS